MRKVECYECQKTNEEVVLRQCKICHKYYCDDHAVQRSGVSFCSMGCAEYFFYVGPEDEED